MQSILSTNTQINNSIHGISLLYLNNAAIIQKDKKEQKIITPAIKGLDDSDDDTDDDDDNDYDIEVHENELIEPPTEDEKDVTDLSDNDQDDDDDDDNKSDNDSSDDDDDIYLDKDISILKMLKSVGYSSLKKLVTTDQGSVWRGCAPKRYGCISVVIKIADKIHYNNGVNEHENILKEITTIRELNIKQSEQIRNGAQIIRVIDTISNSKYYIVILEDGGDDLFNFTTICHQYINKGILTIDEWKNITKKIAKKLIYLINWLHSELLLCHLDISLENILISNISWINYVDSCGNIKQKLNNNFNIKLIDFGACKSFKNLNQSFLCNKIIGKPTYCTPQIFNLQNKINNNLFDARNADIWSLAVSLFIMAIGCPPWSVPDSSKDCRFQAIVMQSNMDYLLNAWRRSHFMDNKMKDLLKKIFVMDENDRIKMKDIIKHSWFCD